MYGTGGRRTEEEQGAGDPKEGRLGEGLMQATMLVIDGLVRVRVRGRGRVRIIYAGRRARHRWPG